MKKATETQLVRACLDYLALMGVFAWRSNSGAVQAEYKGKKRFVRFSGAKGLSDIVGVLRDGRFLAVECKMGKNDTTVAQWDFLMRIKGFGGVALLVRDSVDDLIRQIEPLLNIRRIERR